MGQKPKILVITGPTAVGKSDISIKLACEFDAEIICADSMQIYHGMDIGTGKITYREKMLVPHHLIDAAEPCDPYTVGRYVEQARTIIGQLTKKRKNIIVSGGTGLYINALINGYNFASAECSEEIRLRYRDKAEKEGNEALHQELLRRDPESAQKISANDQKRMIRALEILELTGESKSSRAAQSESSDREFDSLVIVLTLDRAELYAKINARVDKMLCAGLENEVRSLLPYRNYSSMQAIGYKEFINYFDGHSTETEAVADIKKHSRNYAKRQMTFFRSMRAEKLFIDAGKEQDIFDKAKQFYQET